MTTEDAILIRILAHTDAVRLPVRRYDGYTHVNRYFALKAFGVPYRINTGTDEATRKAGERELVALADAGLVSVNRGPRVKYPLCRLTPAGDARARALCWLPDRTDARLFLAAVRECAAKYVDTISGRWCPEIELNDGKGWGEDAPAEDRRGLSLIEFDYLAAAAQGWVDAGSTLCGHVAYVPTPAGLAELAKRSKPPAVGKLPKHDPAALPLYRDARDAKLAELDTRPPLNTKEIGPVPLSVSFMMMLDGEDEEADVAEPAAAEG